MCRKGPVSSSSTGLTPRTFVYHASLAARSVTVTATWVMAGIVVALATLVSCLLMAIVQGHGRVPSDSERQPFRHYLNSREFLTACARTAMPHVRCGPTGNAWDDLGGHGGADAESPGRSMGWTVNHGRS